jgi:hypothetical protein
VVAQMRVEALKAAAASVRAVPDFDAHCLNVVTAAERFLAFLCDELAVEPEVTG